MLLWYFHLIAFIAVTGYFIAQFIKVIRNRYQYIQLSRPIRIELHVRERIQLTFRQMFGHTKLLKDRKSGLMHIIMFYGFIVLQFGALDLIWKGLSGGTHLPLPGYRYFTLIQEITTALILLAVLYAGYRRYVEKLKRLKRGWKPALVLFFIGGLMASVLLSSAFESVAAHTSPSLFAPVSLLLAPLVSGLSASAGQAAFYAAWWSHLLILLSFMLYVPQSKHAHIITAPINLFLQRLHSPGKLSTIDFEDESNEQYGVAKVEDFTQKQVLDFYACVECGRCTNVCPASITGKLLSPMHLITKMRDHLNMKGEAVTSKQAYVPEYLFSSGLTLQTEVATVTGELKPLEDVNLIGDVMTEQEIWACTTCRNCEDQCPVMNEHVDKIIDLRRQLVMMEGNLPAEAQRALTNIERQSNPWGINRNERSNWRELRDDIVVPTVQEEPGFEYLYFVGSMASFDSRSIKIAQSFSRLMNEAGVKFAILGNEEKNSGDTARRIGNEFLFQELTRENIDIFHKYKVKKIVTTDPHAYNTFKNEYPEFGLVAEVYHHTEVLAQWVEQGLLKPTIPIKERLTYHDSCYMGRYNGVYEQPRSILRAIPGIELVEMNRNRENAMCCGAGGGMMWMEETEGSRVNVARVEQALEVQPTMIASACPYCLTMMSDGTKVKDVENQVKTKDIAEILEESIVFKRAIKGKTA